MKTGIVKDKRYTEHHMGPFHVEGPQRIEAIYRMIEEEITFSCVDITPRPALEEEICLIHTPPYVQSIKETSGKERVILDPDTSTSPRSYEVALLAAGGVLKAIDLIMQQEIQNGFALVRPPGHHAEASRAMGFCLFNNIAIGAAYLLNEQRLGRILIVDWDLHHGNGTQHSFFDTDRVLYFSTHQFPHYPGTGHWSETGTGVGEGFTVNVPLYPGKTDGDYAYVYEEVLHPIAAQFNPEFILVSAGFDIYRDDPLGGMDVSEDGFAALASKLIELACECSQDRILFALEGGYDLNGLARGVKQVLLQLSESANPPSVEAKPSPETEEELTPVFETQRQYWKL